jgi:hypothetical protein
MNKESTDATLVNGENVITIFIIDSSITMAIQMNEERKHDTVARDLKLPEI